MLKKSLLSSFLLQNKSNILFFLLFFLVSFSTTLAGAYFYSNKSIDSNINNLLNHAENIAINQINALGAAEKIKDGECSLSDLKALRTIVFQSRYIRDIGKIKNGIVICSALWGRENGPYKLDGGRLTKNGFTIWDGHGGFEIFDTPTDITSIGSSFIVTSPDAFEPYKTKSKVQIEIFALSSNDVLHSFGDTTIEGGTRLKCSNYFDFCVRGKLSPFFDIGKNKFISLAIALGFIISCISTFLYNRWS